jgi:hypothetical protein
VIARRGVGGAYPLLEHREAYADEFGGESDMLKLGASVPWAKSSKSIHTKRDPTRVCPGV